MVSGTWSSPAKPIRTSPDLPEEEVDDDPPEEEDEVVCGGSQKKGVVKECFLGRSERPLTSDTGSHDGR